MSLTAAYHAAAADGRIQEDAAQLDALRALEALRLELRDDRSGPGDMIGALGRAARRILRRGGTTGPPTGIYLWGDVGRGKTWLMDLFFEELPERGKRRVHFHRFMQGLHRDLRQLGRVKDPLEQIGRDVADGTRVLCLDEMQVNDITDAMLMAGLLQALFNNHVTLVTTSNLPPKDLYRGGIQRQRFLPAIDLLERHCRVMRLDGPVDYRLRQLTAAPVYLIPSGPEADAALARHFARLVGDGPGSRTAQESVFINDRPIKAVAAAHGVLWVDFEVLCNIPRSKNDYVELARGYHTVLLSNLRRLDDEQADRVHRLITLVDALYDRRCNLVCSADAAPAALYRGDDLAFSFERTISRLSEMQTDAYMARAHLG
jgi:cell division protein ZapE